MDTTMAEAAAACKLAIALHNARIEAWPDREHRRWDDLPSRERIELVEHAADVLQAVKPLPPRNVTDFSSFLLRTGADAMRTR